MARIQLKTKAANKSQPQVCRILDLGLDGFTECMRAGPNTCRYAIPFGYSFLCSYPQPGHARHRSGVVSHNRVTSGM
jgi:hypothetical protein